MVEISVNLLMMVPIFLPFIVAVFIFGLRKWLKGFSGEIATGTVIVIIAIIAALNNRLSNTTSKIIYGFYNTTTGKEFGAPTGVQFRIDGFSGWFLILLNVIIALILVLEAIERRGKTEGPIYFSLLLFLISGINGVMLANDFFTIFVAWVIVGLSLIMLITFKRRKVDLREGGMRAYILISLSLVLILLAVVLSYGLFGSLNFDYIHDNNDLLTSPRIQNATLLIYLIIALLIVGFGLMANIFLLNLWMPKAIEKADASTQIFSAGIVGGLALLSIFRVLFSFFDTSQITTVNYPFILAIVGLITAFEGALLLVYQVTRNDKENITLSKIIIYTVFVNMGIVLTGLSIGGMISTGSEEALFSLNECFGYSSLQLLNIALTTFLAFTMKDRLSLKRNYSEKLIDLQGIGKEYPLSTFNLVLALASMIGLLPTFGGVNLYMLLFTLIQLGHIGFAIAIIFVFVLLLLSYLVILKYLLFDKPARDTSLISGGLNQDLSLSTFIGAIIAISLIVLGIIPKILGSTLIENAYLLIP